MGEATRSAAADIGTAVSHTRTRRPRFGSSDWWNRRPRLTSDPQVANGSVFHRRYGGNV
jgi:hypothetical protein